MKTFELTVKDIYDKQFNIDFKGYNAQEVDEFLDELAAPEPEPPFRTLLSELAGSHPHLHTQPQQESLNTEKL